MILNLQKFLLLSMLAGIVLSATPTHAMFSEEGDADVGNASTSARIVPAYNMPPVPVEAAVVRRRISREAVRQKLEILQPTDLHAGLMVRTLIQSMEPYASRIQDPAYQTAPALDALWRSQKNKTITFDIARQKALQFFNEINSKTLAKNFIAKLQELNQELAADKQIDTSFAMVEKIRSTPAEASSSAPRYGHVLPFEEEMNEEALAAAAAEAVVKQQHDRLMNIHDALQPVLEWAELTDMDRNAFRRLFVEAVQLSTDLELNTTLLEIDRKVHIINLLLNSGIDARHAKGEFDRVLQKGVRQLAAYLGVS